MQPGDVDRARRARYAAILRRQQGGGKLTAAELAFVAEFERGLAAEARRAREGAAVAAADGSAGPTRGAELEEDLEEWVARDGVLRDHVVRLGQIAQSHGVERAEAERALWGVQRRMLRRYGFEGTARSGDLSGAERQGLQWVVSIEQMRRASQEWELLLGTMRQRRAEGMEPDLESFQAVVGAVKDLCARRDGLVLKVRELGAKERRAGTGRNQRPMGFAIVMADEVGTLMGGDTAGQGSNGQHRAGQGSNGQHRAGQGSNGQHRAGKSRVAKRSSGRTTTVKSGAKRITKRSGR